jgi:hypothetical protein
LEATLEVPARRPRFYLTRSTRLFLGLVILVPGMIWAATGARAATSSPGFSLEHHMEGSTVKVALGAPSQQELEISLWTPNHGALYPSLVDDRRCDGSTMCHAGFDISGETKEWKRICPGAWVIAEAWHSNGWTWLTGRKTRTYGPERFGVCP